MSLPHVLVFAGGFIVVLGTLGSALRTMVVPRGIPVFIVRVVFVSLRYVFRAIAGRSPAYERRDRVLTYYAPVALVALPVVWLSLVLAGYTAMFWALGGSGVRSAFRLSGSSLFTLGFERPADLPRTVMAFSEAGIGIGLLALLISYLPSILSTFSRREAAVALLETRAGAPPFGARMIARYTRIGWPGGFEGVWRDWQQWFVELEESHVSMSSLPFFRSPEPDRSWVTAAGAVLDAAALVVSTVDGDPDPEAQLLIRSGYVSLRRLATYFGLPHDAEPAPDDPISVTREEFEAACDEMAAAGVRVREDREQAWRDFAGWRVNYDVVLLELAALVDAPPAPWSSDRAGRFRRPPLFTRPRLLRARRPRNP